MRKNLETNRVTALVLVTIVVLAFLTNGWRGADQSLQAIVATGYRSVVVDGRWWTIVTSVFFTEGARQLFVVIFAVVVLVVFSERVLGSGRTVIAFVATAVLGTGLGLVAQTVGIAIGEIWSVRVQQSFTVDPMTPIIGTLMTASAFAGPLWRRRITVVTFSAVLLFLLYAGEPSDLYRSCAAVVGLGLGYLYKPVGATPWWPRSSHRETRTLVAAVVATTAIGPIVALIGGTRLGPLTRLGLFIENENAVQYALAVLLVATYGIFKGRRFGAWLAIIVNLILSVLALFYFGVTPLLSVTHLGGVARGFGTWERSIDLLVCTVVPLAVALIVFFNRKHFSVRASRRGVRLYLAGVAVTVAGAVTVTVILGPAASPGHSALRAPVVVMVASAVLWLVVVIGALVVTLRPSRETSRGRARVRALMRNSGGGSFSYWALWEGNHYWFSVDAQAAVAYRVINGIAITTADPVGNHGAARGAIPGFARFCDDNGWTPFFYSIHTESAMVCRGLGWKTQIIGDETVVDPRNWNTAGKQWQDVRTAINRAQREGVTASWTRFSSLAVRHRTQIEELSERWVAEKGLPEMGFTLGGLDELRDDEVWLMVAIDSHDRVAGITSWLPSFDNGVVVGWTLDFMRRTPDGPNGVMEFLIARSAERFRDAGIASMSLSTAPLTRNAVTDESSVVARMLRYIGGALEPVYGFRSLHNFKRKFQPELVPVYIAYPESLSLPAIGLALTRSYLPSLSMSQALTFARAMNLPPSTPRAPEVAGPAG